MRRVANDARRSLAGWAACAALAGLAALSPLSAQAASPSASPAAAALPAGPTYGEHGMALFGGKGGLYASHLPMFHAPHDYQVLLQLHVANPAIDAALRKRLDGKTALWTIAPEKFELDRLAPQAARPLKTFKADLVLGHFEQGGKTQYAGATMVVDKVLLFRQLSPAEKSSPSARYLQIGGGKQRFLVKEIDSRPDYDHIVAYDAQTGASAGAISIAKQGVRQPDDGLLAAALQAPRTAIRGTVYFSTEDLTGMTNTTATTAARTVPPEYEGLWRRQGIWRSNGKSDTATPVWWFQSSSFHFDLRIPVDRPAVADAAALAQLPAEQQAIFARQSGFAGVTVVHGNRAEWRPAIAFPAISAEIDAATMIFRDADHIREDGLDHTYYEEWYREPTGPLHACRLQDAASDTIAYLLIGEHWMAWASGRPGNAYVPGAADAGSWSEFSVLQKTASGWRITASNFPWREAASFDASQLPSPATAAQWQAGELITLPLAPTKQWRLLDCS
jgi:hypothetical protein